MSKTFFARAGSWVVAVAFLFGMIPVAAFAATAISPGVELAGTLAENARIEWSFTGTRGDVVGFSGTANFDSYLEVIDASGTIVESIDDTDFSLVAEISDLELPTSGEYMLRLSSRSGAGNYTLTFTKQPADAGPATLGGMIGSGETKNLLLGSAGAKYYFQATAGEFLTLRAVRAAGEDSVDPKIALFAPDGSYLASDDDSAGEMGAEIFEQPIAESGRYTIRLAAVTDSYGKVDFTIKSTSTKTELPVQTIRFGQTGTGNLSTEHPTLPQKWEFTAAANETIRIQADSSQTDVRIELYSGTGDYLAADDDGGVGRNALLIHRLPANGKYQIWVYQYQGSTIEDPSYLLKLRRVNTPPTSAPTGCGCGAGDSKS